MSNNWKNSLRSTKLVPIEMGQKDNLGARVYASKRAAHTLGLKHSAVHIIVVNEDGTEMLLVKRPKNKAMFKEMWDIAAAEHMEEGYGTPLEVAKALFSKEIQHPWLYEKTKYRSQIKDRTEEGIRTNNEQVFVFVMCRDDLDAKKLEEIFGDNFKWANIDEIVELMEKGKIIPHKYFDGIQSGKYVDFKKWIEDNFKTHNLEQNKDIDGDRDK